MLQAVDDYYKHAFAPEILSVLNFIENSKIPTIVLDNYKYAKDAVKHLIDNGYKKISFISAPTGEMHSVKERYRGYKDALKENKIKFNKSLVCFSKTLRGEWDLSVNYELIEKIISGTNKPDALFIISDPVAMIAIQVIKRMGYKVPDDIGVVGFDDRRLCRYLDTPLTSVYQPKYEMGEKGTELLIKIIEGKKIKEKNIYFDMKLLVRESSNRLKK